jgi:hypothetical protein
MYLVSSAGDIADAGFALTKTITKSSETLVYAVSDKDYGAEMPLWKELHNGDSANMALALSNL